METYVILRRGAWRTPDEIQAAAVRSSEAGNKTPDDVRWLRSYVVAETDGSLGLICVYQAASPEAIRRHAFAAALPVDEIAAVADTIVVQPDPQPIPA